MLPALLALACTDPAPPGVSAPVDSGRPPLVAQAGLVEGGVQECADPAARDAQGAFFEADLGPAWAAQRPAGLDPGRDPEPGAGVVVEDLTGDGLLDVFLPAFTPCQLYVGQPDGTLADASMSHLPNPAQDCAAWGASAADADGDGDLDLFVARNGAPDRLWFNDGAGHFAPSPTSIGLTPHECGSRSGTWGDPDGDGDLDLFVARHHPVRGDVEADCTRGEPLPGREIRPGDANSLYLNQGDGTFVDVSARLGDAGLYGYSFVAEWVDLDADGHLDLYIVNDYGGRAEPNLLLRGDGAGGLKRSDPATGLELEADAMGVAVGDPDENGHPDLAISDIWELHLLMTDGDGSWYDAAAGLSLQGSVAGDQVSSWALEWADLDHDLDLDLVAAYGPTEQFVNTTSELAIQPDGLFEQLPDGTFTERGAAWGLDHGLTGRGMVVLDWDGDGWLDVLKVDYRGGPARLLTQRCGAAAWLTVRLADDAADHPGGARVSVEVGGRTLTRWMRSAGSRLASSGPPVVHFGLGDHDRIDGMTVTWADGAVSEFGPVATHQHLTVVRADAE